MSRKRFDEVERQIRDIGLKRWKSLSGQMIRSAAMELRKGAVVIFGNRSGNLYLRKEFLRKDWNTQVWWKSIITNDPIGLYFDPDFHTVVELNLTEVEKLNERWINGNV